MSEDLGSSLEREGRKAADKDTNFFVELGLLTALKTLEKPNHFSVDDYWDLPPKK